MLGDTNENNNKICIRNYAKEALRRGIDEELLNNISGCINKIKKQEELDKEEILTK